MTLLLTLMILTANPDAPIEGRYPDAVETFTCGFESDWDKNFDTEPDDWVRKGGPGYPHYVTIALVEMPAPEGKQCLKVDMDGGAAAIRSPFIDIGPSFSYVVEAQLKTEQLMHDEAFVRLIFVDEEHRWLEAYESTPIRHATDWTKVRIGPVAPKHREARYAVISLHVQPTNKQDLFASVMLDDVWLGKLPRLTLGTGTVANLFTATDDVVVACRGSGLSQPNPVVEFQLEDVFGEVLARSKQSLVREDQPTTERAGLDNTDPEAAGDFSGSVTWKPPIERYGFYRVKVSIQGIEQPSEADLLRRDLTLVVVQPQRQPTHGIFGWTLDQGEEPLQIDALRDVLPLCGINQVKFPLWYNREDELRTIQLSRFVERLNSQGISVVGLLHDPPPDVRKQLGDPATLMASDIFTPSPKVWYPSLESILLSLSRKVSRWQLGTDADHSFVGYWGLEKKMASIRTTLNQVAQDVQLGFGWGWLDETPASDPNAPYFLALTADPPLTAEELATYLIATQRNGVERWASIAPLARNEYSMEVRAADLAHRMLTAKQYEAEGIFAPTPFDDERGLMKSDGTPGEMFLVWRTTALALSNSKYLGSIQLPGGSPNLVFARNGEALMVAWNDTPAKEVLYLGEDVTITDIWGHSWSPEKEGNRHVIEVGRLPVFVSGLNEQITTWRMGLQLAQRRLPSVFLRPHENMIVVQNSFAEGVHGSAELVLPEGWRANPGEFSVRMGAGQSREWPIQLLLPDNTGAGVHPLRIDFDINADRVYQFSVYRNIEIGLGEVTAELVARIDGDGMLEVDQRLINREDRPVSFSCDLYAPDRRRQRAQVIDLTRGQDDTTYRFENGRELIGKTLWLRAEEIDGPRVLNYHVTVE